MVSRIYIIPSSLKRQTHAPRKKGPLAHRRGSELEGSPQFKCHPPTWFLTAGTLQSRSCLPASLSADQEINWSLSNSCIPLPEQSCGSGERLTF